jgi:hypothetical protein
MTQFDYQPEASVSWPPKPEGVFEPFTLPYKNTYQIAKGYISDFRTGAVTFDETGITITGRAVLKAEILFWILFACMIIGFWLLAAIIFEYAVRTDETLRIEWENVDNILVFPKKKRIAIVYKQTNSKNKTHFFTLGTRIAADQIAPFQNFLRTDLNNRVPVQENGKIHSSNSTPILWTFLIGFITWVIIIIIACLFPTFGK